MYNVCNFSTIRKETDMIGDVLSDKFAYYSDEALYIRAYSKMSDFVGYVSANESIDMSCVEITESCGSEAAETVRKENRQAQLIVISDETTSPVAYLKPTVMACALFLRPLNKEYINKCMCEVLKNYRGQLTDGSNETFTVKTGGEKEYIPFEKILYFEARDKKTYVCTKRKEIGFYGTIEKLEGDLPANFRRCHRSFIVNVNYVERIEISRNSIFLYDGVFVPLSRSYKENFKNIK